MILQVRIQTIGHYNRSRKNQTGRLFNSYIKRFYMFNDALSQEEVTILYNNPTLTVTNDNKLPINVTRTLETSRRVEMTLILRAWL